MELNIPLRKLRDKFMETKFKETYKYMNQFSAQSPNEFKKFKEKIEKEWNEKQNRYRQQQ